MPARQRSISCTVMSSSLISPNTGSRWTLIALRYPRSVEGLQPRSCSAKRRYSAAASANVTPIGAARTARDRGPGAAAAAADSRRTSSKRSCNQSSANRFVKWPSAGRPRPTHAGPILRLTCVPSGKRYLAHQDAPRAFSSRKTKPDGRATDSDTNADLGTRLVPVPRSPASAKRKTPDFRGFLIAGAGFEPATFGL